MNPQEQYSISGAPAPAGLVSQPTVKPPYSEQYGFATIIYHPSLQAAYEAAQGELMISGGTIMNGVFYKQGARPFIAGTLGMPFIRTVTDTDSAAPDATAEEIKRTRNRPRDNDHTAAIVSYLEENLANGVFIIPSLTANINQETRVHTVLIDGPVQPVSRYAYLHLPMNPTMIITDGQHRRAAIATLFERVKNDPIAMKNLRETSVPITITMDDDVDQTHQDFADCAKVRTLPKSLVAVYDRRHPANGFVLDLMERCAIFTDKTDMANSKLSIKNSPGVFLANMVRQAVKTFMTGGYGIGEDDFENKAKQMFGSSKSEEYLSASSFMVEYLNAVTDAIPRLKEYAELTPTQVKARMVEFKNSGYLFYTATGLAILSRIGWAIRKDGATDWRDAISLLGAMDWHRSNPVWADLNVATPTRVSTGHRSVIAGAQYVAREIGLRLPSLEGTPSGDQASHEDGAPSAEEAETATA